MINILKVKGRIDLWSLAAAVLISLSVGILSSFFTMDAESIYKSLTLPSFAPPPWIFGPVWTILYITMGIASYRIWMYAGHNKGVGTALFYYTMQLILNFLWSVIFFSLQFRGFAFLEIILLLVLIIVTTFRFFDIDKPAGLLMVPYLLWVSYASLLNGSIWIFNR